MRLILFGLPGAGKNYAGRILADLYNAHFHDGDDDLTPTMRDYIQRGIPLTDPIRDEFYAVLGDKIAELSATHPRLIIAQALIREKHRLMLLSRFPEVRFIWVQAPAEVMLDRLARRDQHPVNRLSADYAAVIASRFEPPTHPHQILINDRDEAHIRAQLASLIFS